MSNSDALATVTTTLMELLSSVVEDQQKPGVTAKSPSIARKDRTDKQINIFLYATHYNTAFNNAPMPGETRNGEHSYPPLPLVLKYLITAYGEDDTDISGQKLMGHVMSILHDHPVLSGADILSGAHLLGEENESNLHQQVERLHITPDTLSLDDMSKLWTSFQSAEYRLSTGYEVSVVLIDSSRAAKTPLPVLKRGEDDQGPDVVATPSPSLSGLRFTNQKPGAELGDTVTLLGEHLSSDNTTVRLQHPRLDDPIDIQPEPTLSATEMEVKIPAIADDPELISKWPAGFYTLNLVIQRPDTPQWTSNQVSMPLSPIIKLIDQTTTETTDTEKVDLTLTIESTPQIKVDQSVMLLFSDRTIAPVAPDPITSPPGPITSPPDPVAPTTLTFEIKAVVRPGSYVLRLRVDGVDSIPVDFSDDTPKFADNQKVIIPEVTSP